jgi:hypothetical protein
LKCRGFQFLLLKTSAPGNRRDSSAVTVAVPVVTMGRLFQFGLIGYLSITYAFTISRNPAD